MPLQRAALDRHAEHRQRRQRRRHARQMRRAAGAGDDDLEAALRGACGVVVEPLGRAVRRDDARLMRDRRARSSVSAACCIVSQSDWLPMMMPTSTGRASGHRSCLALSSRNGPRRGGIIAAAPTVQARRRELATVRGRRLRPASFIDKRVRRCRIRPRCRGAVAQHMAEPARQVAQRRPERRASAEARPMPGPARRSVRSRACPRQVRGAETRGARGDAPRARGCAAADRAARAPRRRGCADAGRQPPRLCARIDADDRLHPALRRRRRASSISMSTS